VHSTVSSRSRYSSSPTASAFTGPHDFDVSGQSAPPLRGRDEEVGVLDRLCDDVRAGQSSAIVIRGEAGVGKTALLRHVATRAAADFRVIEIAGIESEMELVYAGLHQLCSPILDQIEALPQPQRSALSTALGLSEGSAPDRFLVSLATLTLLAEVAEKQPLMCLIDDAHWLDDASCEVLGFVARRLGAESVAMLLVVRDQRDHGRLAGLSELPLGGVAAAEAQALLASVVHGRLDRRVRDRIVAETRGNPLALLELPRGMSSAELAGGFGLPISGSVVAHLERHYLRRARQLPRPTQQLMLLAAADAVGDAAVIWRAATVLGIGSDAAEPAAREQLLEIGAGIRFHHPLVRSAVYQSASPTERRAAHQALAVATDPVVDPDRRAWHLAHAAAGPDDEVADALERSAERAQARGGFAAAAALLERAATLTVVPEKRVQRRLAATQSNLRAGAFDVAMGLLAMAESEASDEFVHARIEVLRGLVVSASDAGNEAPRLLLKAAKRLEPLDAALARQTYLDAWGAAMFAGHLAPAGGNLLDVSRAARVAAVPDVPRRPFGHILEALALLITDGRAAAVPELRGALHELLTDNPPLPAENWLHWAALGAVAAAAVWDIDSWSAVSGRQVELARDHGALAVLPSPLNGLALIATWRGDFEVAAALAAEHHAVKEATGTRIAPYGSMLLSAYQGRVADASALIAATLTDSVARGEGLGVDLARWSTAILNNGLGRYAQALEVAWPADEQKPGFLVSTWMLPERIEAAVRCGRPEVADVALQEFERVSEPDGSDWSRGLRARSRAMISDGDAAEGLYREAIDRLSRTPIRVELARAHLVFGEWLRRENRRQDARTQLRAAHEMFAAMPANGFAERTRRELLATGEHVRAFRMNSPAELTPQEEHIARLARDGRSNPEIAAELFISARTVEWHLRKVFVKLGITSRRELKSALPGRGQTQMA
jgi:DNA-binding CsgD family transcriptional regulator